MFYQQESLTATIASGGSTSTPIKLNGMALTGLYMPGTWTGTATALRFDVSDDGYTFVPALDASGQYIVIRLNTSYLSSQFSHFIAAVGVDFSSAKYIRIVSHDETSAVNQGADRQITVVIRPYLN